MLEQGEVERVGEGRHRAQVVPRREHGQGEHGERRQSGGDDASRAAARQPEREDAEEKRGQRGEIAAEQVLREARGEEADLHDEHRERRGRHRDQRACPRVPLAAARRLHQQDGERRHRDDAHRDDDVGQVVVGHADPGADRVARLHRRRVRAEQTRTCQQADEAQREQRPHRPERAQPLEVACKQRVDHDGDREHADERDCLCAGEDREHDQRQRDRLVAQRGRRDRAGDRQQGQRGDRVEDDLGHHEPRVEEQGRGERERCGDERVRVGHQPARVDEHRDRRERDDERLQRLQPRVAGREGAE